jgi:hypothetical protein
MQARRYLVNIQVTNSRFLAKPKHSCVRSSEKQARYWYDNHTIKNAVRAVF